MGQHSFESRMSALIRQNHPRQAAALDDETLANEIRRQLGRATHYEMTDELSAATYIYAAWLMGPEFDQRIPSVAQILGSPDLSALAKANALDNFIVTVFHALDGAAAGGAAS